MKSIIFNLFHESIYYFLTQISLLFRGEQIIFLKFYYT